MAGLDKIISEIGAESSALAKELLDKASAQADEIRRQAEQEADASCERIKRESDRRIADAKARAQSGAQLAKRQLLLEEKQNLIGNVLDKARKRFTELPDSAYFNAIIKLVEKNALPQAGEIVLNERDKKRMPANFAQQASNAARDAGGTLKISEKTADVDGGFVLSYGGMDVNCSIGALFETHAEELQDKIQQLLFAET